MSEDVHSCHFEGTCCQCGAAAAIVDPDVGSASFFRSSTQRWSVAKVMAVMCGTDDHGYYTLNYSSEVPDPFAPIPETQ